MKKKGGEWLTVEQAALALGIHSNTLRRWTDWGLVPVHRMGPARHRKYKRVDIEKFIEESAV